MKMRFEFNSANSAADFVKNVALRSYGSRFYEGASGGEGSVGMIGGKVVKFNTHWVDRMGKKVTSEMQRSSDQLREALGSAAQKLSDMTQAQQVLKIYKELGLSDRGLLPEGGGKTLLSRKVAAKVVKMIDQMRKDAGAGEVDSFCNWSVRGSRNKNTSFEIVKGETEKSIAREQQATQEAAKAKARAALDPLFGNNVKGSIGTDLAKSMAKRMLSVPSKYVTKEMHEKISDLITKLLDTGVEPNKAVRLAYVLTEGLDKAAETYLARLKIDGKTELLAEPKDPQPPPQQLNSLFCSFLPSVMAWKSMSPEQQTAAKEQYQKDIDTRDRQMKSLNDFVKQVVSAALGKAGVVNLSLMSENGIGRLMDSMMQGAQKGADTLSPGVFAETAGAGLQKLDGRLAHRIQMENARKPESSSVPTSAMLKLDMNKVMEKTASKIMEKVHGLTKDSVSFKNLSVVPDPKNANTMLVKFSEFKVKEETIKKLAAKTNETIAGTLRMASFKDLAIPIKFGCDPTTGKMLIHIQRMESSDRPDFAKRDLSGLIADKLGNIRQFIYAMLAESPLAGDLHIAERRNDNRLTPLGILDKIAELDEKEMLPIELSPSDDPDVNMLDLKIDPSKFTPFESLGLPPGSKVTSFEMKDGIMSVQVGGKAGKVNGLNEVRGGVSAQVSVGKNHLQLMKNEVVKLMRDKGIAIEDLKITPSGNNGTIRVDVINMNATELLKDIPGLEAAAARLFQNGSYAVILKPKVDQRTGAMVFSFQKVESFTNPIKAAILNLAAGTVAKKVFADNPDFQIEKPSMRAPGEPEYLTQLRVPVESLNKFLPLPTLDEQNKVTVRPVDLKVTDEGLTFGMTGKIEEEEEK